MPLQMLQMLRSAQQGLTTKVSRLAGLAILAVHPLTTASDGALNTGVLLEMLLFPKSKRIACVPGLWSTAPQAVKASFGV